MGTTTRRTMPGLLLILAFSRTHPTAAPACIVEQVTNTTGLTNIFWPVFDASGTRLLFFSSLDLAQSNPDRGLDLCLHDTTSMAISQVTSFNPAPFLFQDASISADGTRAIFIEGGPS